MSLTKVAPYVGAWIETYDTIDEDVDNKSHPTWVRGLKLIYYGAAVCAAPVAPYVGAWIETSLNSPKRS